MVALSVVLASVLGVVAVAESFRRRAAILVEQPRLPSADLVAVLVMDLAAVLLLASVGLSSASGPVLVALPLAILAGYIALLVLVFGIRPKWRKSPLFLLSAFAPLWGPVFAFLVLLADRRKPE